MASETRKLKRAADRQSGESKGSDGTSQPPLKSPIENPLGADQLKGMLGRLLIPVAGAWLVGGLVAAFAQTTVIRAVAIAIPAILTLLAAAVVFWALRQSKKAQGVAGILSGVETAEDRKAAIAQLDATYKKNDPTAVFARAQLEMQDDPKQALKTLEQIDLSKVMATVADETRARALVNGEDVVLAA